MAMREMVVLVLAMLVLLATQMETTEAVGIDHTSSSSLEFYGWKSERQLSTTAHHEDAVDEFLDEPTRRLLVVTRTYISYGALTGNRTPCPSAGRSYYSNCKGAPTPYRRSCIQITRCARG